MESVWKVHGSVWQAPGKCVGSAREVSEEAVLGVVGSEELSANTCEPSRKDVLRHFAHKMRMPGVEPGSQAWEACMMPLHYMRHAITNASLSLADFFYR